MLQHPQQPPHDAHADRPLRGDSATWPASERVLVCVSRSPASERLVRAAARLAGGLRCPWVAAYVDTGSLAALGDVDRERLEAHLRAAEALGATVTRLSGARVADALLAYARRNGVTRIVIGKPTHARLRDRLQGSLLDDVVRGSGDIDVHVISGEGADGAAPRAGWSAASSAPPSHYAAATLLVAVTVGVAQLLRDTLAVPDPEMLFVLTVMVSAVRLGRGPSLLAAGLGVACYDYFFLAPLYTFSVSDQRYFLTFAMMFGVGWVMSELTGRVKRQERDAHAREERTAVLYALTKDLASADEPTRIAEVSARHAADIFGARAIVLHATGDGALVALGAAPPGATLDAEQMSVARWALEHGALAGAGTDVLAGSHSVCAPLCVGASALGVLALLPADRAWLRPEQRAFLEVFGRQVALALARARLADEARSGALRAKAEETRSSLLSAVSHDLRTPLAAITGAATSLRDDANLPPESRADLVSAICDEAERLERLVANLLDMTRLAAGASTLRRDWVPLDEIVGSALARLEARLGDRAIELDVPGDLPMLFVDPVLFEQLVLNLLENASKYTPPGTPIEVHARAAGDTVAIEIRDRGPGVPPGDEERVFEKFYRGQHVGVAGVGLGLPICRAIADAHGGTIRALARSGGGSVFRVELPAGAEPPSVPSGDGGLA